MSLDLLPHQELENNEDYQRWQFEAARAEWEAEERQEPPYYDLEEGDELALWVDGHDSFSCPICGSEQDEAELPCVPCVEQFVVEFAQREAA